jgi:hypothetical protein
MEMITSYQRLQAQAALVFGLAASSDVPEVMLQMPDAAAQLVVDLLLWRGILCFEGGVRGDVFRRFFGPNDFLRKQIKAKENEEEVKHEIIQESKKQDKGKLTLEWCVSLRRCPPWVACLCPWL